MRVAVAVSLLAVACASPAPPLRAGGPADPRAPEGPVATASPELAADSGLARYERSSTPMMGNMQMDGGMQMGGMGDGGMKHQMGGMQMDGGMR